MTTKKKAAKRMRVQRLLRADQTSSNRSISRKAGCSDKTVAAIRAELFGRAEFCAEKEVEIPHSNSAPVDPRAVLEEIAADKDQPAGPRVAACKVLIALEGKAPEADSAPGDELNRRAIALMNGRLN
jgi:hypothetical protein